MRISYAYFYKLQNEEEFTKLSNLISFIVPTETALHRHHVYISKTHHGSPLRAVRCSFPHLNKCSWYGKRGQIKRVPTFEEFVALILENN